MDTKVKRLTPKQEKFCQLYASSSEFFGNGTHCYIQAYEKFPPANETDKARKKREKIASASAAELLGNPRILDRVNSLLSSNGLNDSFVDKQLLFIIQQHFDYGAKMGAIREYNKLKGRITEKVDHTSKGKSIIPILGGRTKENDIPRNNSPTQNKKKKKKN